jgi:hypothetical protein
MAFMFLPETIASQNDRAFPSWLLPEGRFCDLYAQKGIWSEPARALLGVHPYVSGCFSFHFGCLIFKPHGRRAVN